jgi:hypothetical protein
MSPLSIVTVLVDKIGKQDQLLCMLRISSNCKVLLGLGKIVFHIGDFNVYMKTDYNMIFI